jgi:hypothetical protein
MNYITTNIRFPEDLYMELREEAAKKRMSLAAIVRQRVGAKTQKHRKTDVAQLSAKLDAIAKELGDKLQGFDATAVIRTMRQEG